MSKLQFQGIFQFTEAPRYFTPQSAKRYSELRQKRITTALDKQREQVLNKTGMPVHSISAIQESKREKTRIFQGILLTQADCDRFLSETYGWKQQTAIQAFSTLQTTRLAYQHARLAMRAIQRKSWLVKLMRSPFNKLAIRKQYRKASKELRSAQKQYEQIARERDVLLARVQAEQATAPEQFFAKVSRFAKATGQAKPERI